MQALRRFSVVGLVLLLFVGVSCTSTDTSLTEPTVAASADQRSPSFSFFSDFVTGTVFAVQNLLTCSRQPYVIATETIGPSGGTIVVGSHSLFIPENALSQNVTITAEQMRGSTNSVRFRPEGLRFDQPALLTMSYENCSVVLLQKKIVFTTEQLKILEVLRSLDLFVTKTVTAPIDHFSRYAVAY
jgi:hypothetical protein